MIQATRKTVCAIIPAFGEARFIGTVIGAVLEHLDHVIVVDDHSPDQTAAVARAAGAEVIRHCDNLGKGAAIKTGLSRAADRFGFFLFMDGDGQHDPAEIPKFLAKATATQAHLIVGNRMWNVAGMPAIRRWTNKFMSWQISRLCQQEFPDSQCGYRMARYELLPLLQESSDGFAFETESLLLAACNGFQIELVPVRTIYRDERSKIKPLRDTFRYIRVLAKYRAAHRVWMQLPGTDSESK
ncbi:MAG TPA: glycosyltransferase family 2 protein [Chthoniobacterales bacterium]|nr:glycosyltransferase family 2 protein [Chthoniobacterales bacterium]